MNTVTAIDFADLDINLRDELDDAPEEWTCWDAPYESATVSNQGYHIAFHAAAQRGGIVFVGSGSSGTTSWTDAASAEEVLARFLADDMIN